MTASDTSLLGTPGDRPPRRVMRQVLLAEWQAGSPMVNMEREHHMAHRTVRRLLEEAGADLPPRRDMFNLRGIERAAFAATLLAEYDADPNLTIHALAKQHDVSPQTARKLLGEARRGDDGVGRQLRIPLGVPAFHAGTPTLAALCGLEPVDAAEYQLQQQAEPSHTGRAVEPQDHDHARRKAG